MSPPSADQPIVLGIDLGTAGVRVLATTACGDIVAGAESPLPAGHTDGVIHEQDPESWWRGVVSAVQDLMHELGRTKTALRALAVDGTSGTLVCLNKSGQAVRPAMMYSDLRAEAEAAELSRNTGQAIPPSFAIAKMRWLMIHEPENMALTELFTHQADYIALRLGAGPGVSDYSNALKSGYDVVRDRWPAWLDGFPDIRSRLPRVVAPATRIGTVRADIAEQLGLPAGMAIVSGVTDGTAAFLASGARRPGDYNTTLGTTLVFKALSTEPCSADGLVYCHRLPGGYWLPGAASSTGGEWLREYDEADLPGLDRKAQELLPCEHLAYPLMRIGERFPFAVPQARGFMEPETDDPTIVYAARLQGVAFLERLGYEILDRTTGLGGGDVHAAGGGSRSDIWMQLRADVTGRVLHRPEFPESAFGAAILAAAATVHTDVWEAVRLMVRHTARFEPNPARRGAYDQLYGAFLDRLKERGLLTDS